MYVHTYGPSLYIYIAPFQGRHFAISSQLLHLPCVCQPSRISSEHTYTHTQHNTDTTNKTVTLSGWYSVTLLRNHLECNHGYRRLDSITLPWYRYRIWYGMLPQSHDDVMRIRLLGYYGRWIECEAGRGHYGVWQ